MPCVDEFTVSDGATQVTVKTQSVSDQYQIERELLSRGMDNFHASEGTSTTYVRYKHYQYTISGRGPGDPKLWTLAIENSPWTVSIPGFDDGSANEVWTVLPAYPRQIRDRRAEKGQEQNWSITFESAVAQ